MGPEPVIGIQLMATSEASTIWYTRSPQRLRPPFDVSVSTVASVKSYVVVAPRTIVMGLTVTSWIAVVVQGSITSIVKVTVGLAVKLCEE